MLAFLSHLFGKQKAGRAGTSKSPFYVACFWEQMDFANFFILIFIFFFYYPF